ncbi:MAG TPA: hypothetical protein PK794_01885, partial [Armatimonadota bacterium]|nr:hypothetical protein [Armatimonadota bacterium]
MTHLLLAGFPGTDAPAVGRMLAARLRLPFLDAMTLDAEGMAALIADETSAVVTVDGALLTAPDTLELARRAGPLVRLIAGAMTPSRRAGARTGTRPEQKVAEPLAKMREMLESRQSAIPPGDIEVDAMTLEPVEAVEQVLDWLNQVRVHLGERAYDIRIADGCHADVGPFLARLPERVSSVVLISHRSVYRHYGD